MHLVTMIAALALSADPVAFVAVAPGYPGTTAEAQASMDAFASALAAAAGLPAGSVVASYHEKDKAGVERLQKPDAALGMVALPFFLQQADALQLEPRLSAVQKGAGATETWALVAKKGRVTGPSSLEGWQVISIAGYAPAFVTGTALAGWGRMPGSVKVVQSGQVLSALRKAAAGENLAVLLDGSQAAALPGLPFAADLEVVARSAPLPTGLIVTVGKRLSPDRWKAFEKALRQMASSPAGTAALEAIRLQGFAPLDAAAVAAARKAYGAAAR
ncbi:MAG: PhnD/SsuA/transferrin family substrate-binding protein [Anaeromyxobacteraceae bacterium]